MALSNADKVKLYLNGKLVSEQEVNPYEMNTWMVPYKPGKLEAVGYKDGKIVSRKKVETTGEAYCIRLTPDRNSLMGNGCDAMPVTVEVLDRKGRHVPTACHPIEFTISGPAKIIGLGNGNPNCHEPEKGNKRSLFNGLAQVIIQSTEEADGEICLKATSPGIQTTTLVLPSVRKSIASFVPSVAEPLMLDKWLISPLYSDKPDVMQRVAENDMNSWQPSSGEINISMNKADYVILRTSFEPKSAHQKHGGIVVLRQVTGKAEVWLDGTCIGTKESEKKADFTVPFSEAGTNCELRILLCREKEKNVGMAGCMLKD